MYEDWFNQPANPEKRVWDPAAEEATIFSEVLNDKISPKVAVDRFNGPSTQSKGDKEDRLWRVWNMLYDAAADLPDAHPRLLEIMSGFETIRMDVWRDFFESLRRHDAIPSPKRWTNFNAFSAKLSHITEEKGANAVIFGLFVHRHALEVSKSQTLSPDICAAANWIKYAGKTIFMANNNEAKENWARALHMETELWKGAPGFNRERWAFWKERYNEMATRDDVTEEAKTLAKEASDEMTAIESGK